MIICQFICKKVFNVYRWSLYGAYEGLEFMKILHCNFNGFIHLKFDQPIHSYTYFRIIGIINPVGSSTHLVLMAVHQKHRDRTRSLNDLAPTVSLGGGRGGPLERAAKKSH